MRRLLLTILLVLLPSSVVAQTVREVGPGRTHATIQSCLTAAVAGDTCDVYSKDYTADGVVSSVRDGTSNTARITIQVHAGQTATVRGFYISHNWTTVSGFIVNTGTTSSIGIDTTSSTGVIIENNHVTAERNTCIRASPTSPTDATHYAIRNNTVTRCGWALTPTGSGPGIESYGSYAIVEGNDISHCTDDPVKLGGDYVVVRDNVAHDFNTYETGQTNTVHFDFIHNGIYGVRYALIEGNTYRDIVDPDGEAHGWLLQGYWGGADEVRNVIVRYNYIVNIDNTAGGLVGGGSYTPYYTTIYANTHADAVHGATISSGAAYARVKNNIWYDITYASHHPIYDGGSSNFQSNGNLPYTTGYSGEWTNAIASEATYNTLKNKNPAFTNYPTTCAIPTGSPAKDAGVALTTVAAADTGSGTSLVLTDASYFQPGWGPSWGLVNADQIRIGASTYATIASIDYATNTITLTAGVSRSDGDPVYLYKKSDGDTVLVGTLPDVGAYEFGAGAVTPNPPTNVRIK